METATLMKTFWFVTMQTLRPGFLTAHNQKPKEAYCDISQIRRLTTPDTSLQAHKHNREANLDWKIP